MIHSNVNCHGHRNLQHFYYALAMGQDLLLDKDLPDVHSSILAKVKKIC